MASSDPSSSGLASYFEGPKCTWNKDGGVAADPHAHETDVAERFVGPLCKPLDTIVDHIGFTPLVKLNHVIDDLPCTVYAKCEFFNAGGSVKDRIGRRMILDAEKSGRIKPGDTIIEPTSGNTGIGLALTAAVRGYKMIVTMPEKMSNEKIYVLKALGAQIIRTPNEAAFDSPDSHIGVALRLNKEIPNSHILDQYANPSNPLAHYDGTAEEILVQTGGKISMLVAGAGTGGTIAGLGRKLKEKAPDCKIVGVDPVGSILAQPESLNVGGGMYQVEGIGYDFIPKVLDRSVVDHWYKSVDKASLLMSRRLIREEGLLCGGSSGTAVHYAIQACRDFKLTKDDVCVVILPDSVRNYMTKFLSPSWMIDNQFADETLLTENQVETWWSATAISDLALPKPLTIAPAATCAEAVAFLDQHGFDQVPVMEGDELRGVVSSGNLASKLQSGRVKMADPVTACLYTAVKRVAVTDTLGALSQLFDVHHFVLVEDAQGIVGLASRIDLLKYIAKNEPQPAA